MQAQMETIDAFGDPLAFKFHSGTRESAWPVAGATEQLYRIEARQLSGHQKEAVVTGGEGASAWRVSSDEGGHLQGTDLAPFPLGFFNAGLQSDLFGRLSHHARSRGIALESIGVRLENRYWLTGSFVAGTGEGHAEPSQFELTLTSRASDDEIRALVKAAVDSSPAIALLRNPLQNTFALYLNGRRRPLAEGPNSRAPDVIDPYLKYSAPPRPASGATARPDLIRKGQRQEPGASVVAPPATDGRVVRVVKGEGRPAGSEGMFEVETWLEMPGASHFIFQIDESSSDGAPQGLALLSAGIAFCYMTQLSRYIENMHLPIKRIRLVQFNPYRLTAESAGQVRGAAGPIDTHLFLDGEAPEETHARLLRIAARTCYLHATAEASLEPAVRLVHNGRPVA
ncbi:MAG TPA: OsmC family protein [Myxococcaceae bacterium]|nr:OsmC family protein [Myxococcaceae bacterium]